MGSARLARTHRSSAERRGSRARRRRPEPRGTRPRDERRAAAIRRPGRPPGPPAAASSWPFGPPEQASRTIAVRPGGPHAVLSPPLSEAACVPVVPRTDARNPEIGYYVQAHAASPGDDWEASVKKERSTAAVLGDS